MSERSKNIRLWVFVLLGMLNLVQAIVYVVEKRYWHAWDNVIIAVLWLTVAVLFHVSYEQEQELQRLRRW